jgi:3-methyladenine DNA glycosylase AlkC
MPTAITPDGVLDEVRGKGILAIRRILFDLSRHLSPEQSLSLAQVLYQNPDVHGPMAAALLAGHVSYILPEAMRFLKDTVALHPQLKVQDCLSKAFDHYCLNLGFERAMPEMRLWAQDPKEFVRRAVIEAPRPWTKKDYFKARPQEAVSFIAALKGDPSPYVRFSAGVALSEISQEFPDQVIKELETWDRKDPYISNTYSFAARHVHTQMGKVFLSKPGTATA